MPTAHELHRREVARRRREKVGGPAEDVVRFPKGVSDGVEGNRADDEDSHVRGVRGQSQGRGY